MCTHTYAGLTSATISMMQAGETRTATTVATIQQLLRASIETWYDAIWLPRCQRAIEQERSQGIYQGAKLHRMRAPSHDRTNAPPSPTPTYPPALSNWRQTGERHTTDSYSNCDARH